MLEVGEGELDRLVEGEVAAALEVLLVGERHLDDHELTGVVEVGVGGAVLEAAARSPR